MKPKLKLHHFILALVMMPIAGLLYIALTTGFRVRELKALGTVKPFSLENYDGRVITSDYLKKKVWIASFIFTRCSAQCPRISAEMESLQQSLYSKENINFVSFTVDPKNDTKDKMALYAERYHANPERWFFLTGKPEDLEKLIVHSFMLVNTIEAGTIVHSSKLALVDGTGIIRGYYDAYDLDAIKMLIKDAKSLLRGLY